MKKLLLVLGMLTCMLGLTACGTAKTNSSDIDISEEDAATYGDQIVDSLNQIVVGNLQDQFSSDATVKAALESWSTAAEEMGTYQSIESHNVKVEADRVVIDVGVIGSKKHAVVEIILDDQLALKSITTNVTYSPIDYIKKYGVVIAVGLVLIIVLVIVGIRLIPKRKASKLEEEANGSLKQDGLHASVDNTIAQIARKEELLDDLELVAVITAAIAAYQSSTVIEGFAARSIKRAGRRKRI